MPELADLIPMLAVLLVIGAFAGVVGGLLGVGGGIVLVPAFFYAFGHLGFGGDQLMQVCVATSMATIVITSLRSVSSHNKKGAVDWEVLKTWGPTLLVVARDRAQRGDDDGCHRGSNADLHQLVTAVAEASEGVEEGRDKDDPAADAQQPADDAGEGSDHQEGDKHGKKQGKLGHGSRTWQAGCRASLAVG